MVEHVDIVDGERHEPKGIDSAAANTAYVAAGAGGTGAWEVVPTGLIGAANQQAFIASGPGAGAWQYPMVHGGLTMPIDDVTVTNYPITGSGSGGGWTRVNTGGVTIGTCTSTAGTHPEFTASATGELTYTGSLDRHNHIVCTVSLQLDSGAALETVRAAVFHYDASLTTWSKIDHSEVRCSVNGSTTTASVAMHADLMLSTNDQLVVGVYNPTSIKLVVLRSYYLFAMGMVGG